MVTIDHKVLGPIVAKYLKNHLGNLEKYSWNEKINLRSLEDLKIFSDRIIKDKLRKDPFTRDTYLKEQLSKSLKNKSDKEIFNTICQWIIKDWGGINSGFNDRAKELVLKFMDSETDSLSFERIASVSKVISFIRPHEHIIYDSRVASTVNWILLQGNVSNGFFPVPEGRNSKLAAFDISTIIRLKFCKKYQIKNRGELKSKNFISTRDNDLFIDKSDAYKCLKDLIKEINRILWANNPERRDYPFYTEMLLFSIADNIVYEDIVSRTEIKIK